jgi:hypothetical protein
MPDTAANATGQVQDQTFLEECSRIIEEADVKDVVLRIMGSLAFKLHCTKYAYLSEQMNRKLTDIDLASYSPQQRGVDNLLRSLGYTTHSYVQLAAATMGRSIYWKGSNSVHIDIFWDQLQMNHTIKFAGRLEKDKPTIPLAELLQEKFQIVRINWKDIKDVIMLMLEHDISETENGRESIDLSVITKALANDWGYYYTFTQNIKETHRRIDELTMLSQTDRQVVQDKLTKMLAIIENAPKTTRWRLRAKVGTKRIWYTEVGDV